MFTSNKRRKPTRITALAVTFGLVVASSTEGADDLIPAPQPANAPFKLSPNSVLKGDRLIIGDVGAISLVETETLIVSASADESVWQRCLEAGPNWLRASEDGMTVELQRPWGVPDEHQLLTAQCDDGAITIGGYSLRGPDEDPDKRAMLFLYNPSQDGPVTITITKQVRSGIDSLTLNEVAAIDSASGRILFSATSENGRQSLVTAPYRLAYKAPVVSEAR